MGLPSVSLHCSLLEFHYNLIQITLSLPNVAKGKFRPNFQISFSKILRNKFHQAKVQAESFHLNGHIIGFRPQTQKLESLYKTLSKNSGSERANNIKLTSWYLPQNGELFSVYK